MASDFLIELEQESFKQAARPLHSPPQKHAAPNI
jgi:hypothetical protein